VKFFTYSLYDERRDKFVLYGLPKYNDTNPVKTCLIDLGITPAEVSILNIKKLRYPDQCHYLLYFKKSDGIKLSKLREIKFIANTAVRFEYYRKPSHIVSMCSNCQSYGHGSNNCYLTPKCCKCGDTHKTIECPFSDKNTKRVQEDKLKCANCGEKHAANYSKCKKRDEFLSIQQKAKPKNKFNTLRHQYINSVSRNYTTQYPLLSTKNSNQLATNTQWADVVSNNHSSELFTHSELINILKEMVMKLKKCKCKSEQLIAIGSSARSHNIIMLVVSFKFTIKL